MSKRINIQLTKTNAIKLYTAKIILNKPIYIIINRLLDRTTVEDLVKLFKEE